ncbi:MAG: hypothetical protein HY247_00305 [archaeon]|nr:MAG: hypothetical protein HY247_00305 [archaeon]
MRSYASLTYDAFGFGTPPFNSPISVERGGIVTRFIFDGTEIAHQVSYPATLQPEPIPSIRLNQFVILRNGAQFGGTVAQVSVTNVGFNETAGVDLWSSLESFQTPLILGSGQTALLNSTTWTGPVPAPGTVMNITLYSRLQFAHFWLYSEDTYHVQVLS